MKLLLFGRSEASSLLQTVFVEAQGRAEVGMVAAYTLRWDSIERKHRYADCRCVFVIHESIVVERLDRD